jgi:hypothetical protein
MNQPTKGYFCLVQYCPDLARKEVANVGVMLFSPEHGFLEARLDTTNRRVHRFFGSHEIHAKHVKLMKEAFVERIHVERKNFANMEDLCVFVQTRANHIILTPPKAVRVVSPEADLEALYATLVADLAEHEEVVVEPSKALAIRKRLDQALSSPDLLPKIRTGLRIQVPLMKTQVEIPFGFQNGRFNLIQPASFKQAKVSTVKEAACRYAVEGRSLYEHRDSELGDLQLVVVADFQKTGDEGAEAVTEIFREYQVKLYTAESLDDLKEEIRQHGKILTA